MNADRKDWIPEPDPEWQRSHPGWDKPADDGHSEPNGNGRDKDGLPHILTLGAFHKTLRAPDYVIEGIIQRGFLYAGTALTGHAKTAIWLHNGYMVARGQRIGNLRTQQGTVVYLAGENPTDFCIRSIATCQELGIDPNAGIPFHVMPGNFPIDADKAEKLKVKIETEVGQCLMVVGDTATAYFPGEDDNHNVQMAAYARNVRVLTTCRGNPAVVMLGHPIKNATKDNLIPHGGGAYLNEIDGNLTAWSDVMGEASTMHWQGKFRGQDFQPLHYALRQVKLAHFKDQWGQPFVTVIAEMQSPEAADNARSQAITDEDAVLYWLNHSPGMSIAAIAEHAGWVNDARIPLKAKVQRCLQRLKNEKPPLVKPHRGKWIITDAGKAELNAKRTGNQPADENPVC